MEEQIKPKRNWKKILFILLGIPIFIVLSFFLVTGVLYISSGQTGVDTASSPNYYQNPINLNNNSVGFVNGSGDEQLNIDKDNGNLYMRGNLTANYSNGNGYGYFRYLGDVTYKITQGFFSYLHADYVNSTQVNASSDVYINTQPVYKWLYNESTATFGLYNAQWNSTYNATYDKWAYNQTDAVGAIYVPYQGATGNVNLSVNNITAGIGSYFGDAGNHISFTIINISDGIAGYIGNFPVIEFLGDNILATGLGGIRSFSIISPNEENPVIVFFNESFSTQIGELGFNLSANEFYTSTDVCYINAEGVRYCLLNINASFNSSFVYNNYVPYTGAIENVDLGLYNLTSEFSIQKVLLNNYYGEYSEASRQLGVSFINNGTVFSTKDITEMDYIIGDSSGIASNNLFGTTIYNISNSSDSEIFSNIFTSDIRINNTNTSVYNSYSSISISEGYELETVLSSLYNTQISGYSSLSSNIYSISSVTGTAGVIFGAFIGDHSVDYNSNLGGTIQYNGVNIMSEGATSLNIFEGSLILGNNYGGIGGLFSDTIVPTTTLDIYGSGINVSEGNIFVAGDYYGYDDAYFSGDVGIGTELPTHKLNVVGDVNITGNTTYNSYYGGMWMHNDSGLTAIFNSTYQKIYFDMGEHLNGFTFANSQLQLIGDGGVYQVIYHAEGDGAQNHEYHTYTFVNEILQNNTIGHAIGEASNSVKVHGLGFIRLNKYDNVSLRIADLTSSVTGSQIDANLNLVRIGN